MIHECKAVVTAGPLIAYVLAGLSVVAVEYICPVLMVTRLPGLPKKSFKEILFQYVDGITATVIALILIGGGIVYYKILKVDSVTTGIFAGISVPSIVFGGMFSLNRIAALSKERQERIEKNGRDE